MIHFMASCGGCKTCEIACNFHHTGVFSFTNSSIRILNKNDEKGYYIEILDSCDNCKNEKMPLCMQYCEEKESLEKILSMFKKIKEQNI